MCGRGLSIPFAQIGMVGNIHLPGQLLVPTLIRLQSQAFFTMWRQQNFLRRFCCNSAVVQGAVCLAVRENKIPGAKAYTAVERVGELNVYMPLRDTPIAMHLYILRGIC